MRLFAASPRSRQETGAAECLDSPQVLPGIVTVSREAAKEFTQYVVSVPAHQNKCQSSTTQRRSQEVTGWLRNWQ